MRTKIVAEQLEFRRLLAGTATLEAEGVLAITGDDLPNRIVAFERDGNVEVEIDGVATGTFPADTVIRLRFAGLGGPDRILNRLNISSKLDGGAGNDTLIGGFSSDSFFGGPGDDLMVTSEVTPGTVDTSFGHSFHGGAGADRVDYCTSPNAILFSVFDDQVVAALKDRFTSEFFDEDIELIQLTPFDDEIYTIRRVPIDIDGRGGNDFFNFDPDYVSTPGLSRTPRMFGGSGDDFFDANDVTPNIVLDAGPGDDRFELFDPSPTLFGGGGQDSARIFTLIATSTQEIDLRLCAGVERFVNLGGDGQKTIVYAPDDSALLESDAFNPGPLTLFGGNGNDTLISGTKTDSLDGGPGNDSLVAGDGDDTLRGGDGDDTLSGGAGRDKLYGDAGDDLLLARGGSRDRVDGGTGTDAATRDNGPSVFDQLFNIETKS